MEQLIGYLKTINGSAYPKNMNNEDTDDDHDSDAESNPGVDDEEVRAVAEHNFTVNFDLLQKKKRRVLRRPIPPWWNESCEEALLERKRAKKTLKRMGDENQEENLKAYRLADKHFKKTTKMSKKAYYKKVEKEIEMHETVAF